MSEPKIKDVLKKMTVDPVWRDLNVQVRYMATELRLLQACHDTFVDVPLDKLISSERILLSQIKEVFYDATNLLDFNYLDVYAESSEPATNPDAIHRLIEKVRDPSHARHLIAYMRQITAAAMNIMVSRTNNSLGPRPLVDLYKEAEETELIGMDGPRDELIKRLAVGDNSMKKVSIVGIGGSGKTTLAHVVYHQLKETFDCSAFVTAPTEPGMGGVFTEMLDQLNMVNHMNMNEEQVIAYIKQFLQHKRYLVVVDDLRNYEDWLKISFILPNNDHGSRVITTSRFNGIANQLCSSGCDEWIYQIHLEYQDSRKLFLKRFFGSEVSCPSAPTDVFYRILKMCGGTPSEVISIASFLASEVTATKPWQEMMNSAHSAWKQSATVHVNIPGFEDLKRILSHTYLHLPISLKDCLMYIAIHANKQMIYRTTTVRKWIAEGFISQYGKFSREEVASQYFDELIERSFIHASYLEEEIYEVDYMVMYVLRLISQEIHFATVLSDVGISSEYGHSVRLSIQCSGSELSIQTEKMDISGIRSITMVGPAKLHLTNDLVYLRVLDLDGCKDLDNSAMNHICRMIWLKYLRLKHTLVTKIPAEIGELRCLEILDIRQSKIRKLPEEIRKLGALKTLDASCTQISRIPPGFSKLQNLETLDLRQAQVSELPREILSVPKLAYLYFGLCSSPQRVRLPLGSQRLTSLKVFGTVDSREWSESAMEDISGLTEVKELEIVLHDQPADKDQNDKLLSAICKCENLEYLIIYGSYNPGEGHSVCPVFRRLERLKVAGKFMKVPQWMAQLSTLKKLDMKVCNLDQDDLKILGGLPALSNLALALIRITREKEVAITRKLHPEEEISPEGFTSLEVFSFECHVPWITFKLGAMPLLNTLHLKLYACPEGKFPSGIINLLGLKKIILRYSSRYASSGGVKKAVFAITKEASSHINVIDVYVNGNYEVLAANGTEASIHGNPVELSVNADHEELLSNARVHETITNTEIEEASNNGNPVELSVYVDHDVLLSNTRVDETITGTEIKECY